MGPWISKIGKIIGPYVKEFLIAVGTAVGTVIADKGFREAKRALKKWRDNRNNPDSSEATTE